MYRICPNVSELLYSPTTCLRCVKGTVVPMILKNFRLSNYPFFLIIEIQLPFNYKFHLIALFDLETRLSHASEISATAPVLTYLSFRCVRLEAGQLRPQLYFSRGQSEEFFDFQLLDALVFLKSPNPHLWSRWATTTRRRPIPAHQTQSSLLRQSCYIRSAY